MKAIMTFGRMNPPTIGHQLLLSKLLELSKKMNARPFVFVSHKQDSSKNPLSFGEKIKFISLGYPSVKKYLVQDASIKDPFTALKYLVENGYDEIIVIVGSDRVVDFEKMIKPYLNIADKSKSIDAKSVKVISIGDRDPDSEGVSGWSASKMRSSIASGQYVKFKSGVMSGLNDQQSKELYNLLRKKMSLHSEIFVIKSFLDFTENSSELENRFSDKLPNLEIGTDELVAAYKRVIPGQLRK